MNPFLRVIEALNRHDVRYVIVGGFAAVMHGLDRSTQDLDIYVDLEPSEARKAVEALLSIGLRSRTPVDPLQFADPQQRASWLREKGALVFTLIDPDNPIFAVDLFTEPPLDPAALFARSKLIRVRDLAFRVCSLDDLIAMKVKSGRPQDLLDVQVLRQIQSGQGKENAE